MAYDQWQPDEREEEWMAVILTLIIGAIVAGCVFGVRGCVRNNKEVKAEKTRVINGDIKYNAPTFFVKSLSLNTKIK